MNSKFFAIVAGAGAGTGRACALKFAKTYPVVLMSRSADSYAPIVDEIKSTGGSAVGVSIDVSSPDSVSNAFDTIKQELGDAKLAAAVYNVGGTLKPKPFLDMTVKEFDAGYDANGRGLFLFAQKALPLLLASVDDSPHPPSLIATGATAGLKGSAKFASFAAGKFAMRAICQSMAREFGPQGVHVAHAIVDGIIDIPRSRDLVVNGGVEDGKLKPDAIAETYWNLHTQSRSAFTHELEIRPYVEKW